MYTGTRGKQCFTMQVINLSLKFTIFIKELMDKFFSYSQLIRSVQVWDSNIIDTAAEDFYDSEMEEFVDAIKKNITVR